MADRPRGRPEKVTPEIRLLISDIYVELSKKEGVRPYVEDVYGQLGVKLAERNKPLVIAKSTVRSIMQELKTEALRTQNEEMELDEPWSVGASYTHGIPPEVTPTLLEIKRWCILTGQSFTVRQARWVAYLQNTAGMKPTARDSRIAALFHQACGYALREKACKLLGTAQVYTFDLDIQRMEWDWEIRRFAEQTGAIPPRHTLDDWESEDRRLFLQAEFERRGEAIDVVDYPWIWNTSTDPEIVLDAKLGINPPPQAPQAESADEPVILDSRGKEIYALSISYLSKGPKWDGLTEETRDYMAAVLKLEIRKHQLEVQIAREKLMQEGNPFAVLLTKPGFEDWKIPAHYLRTVGYDVEKDA